MNEISLPRLIRRRLAKDWALLISVFLGILIATSLVAGAPVYLKALDRLAFGISLSEFPNSSLSISIFASHIPLSREGLDEAEQALTEAIDLHISHFHAGDEKYLRTGTFLVGHKLQPLPERRGTAVVVSRGYFQHLSNLGNNSVVVEGRMAGDSISVAPRGPELEAVVGLPTAEEFAFDIGDVVTLTPSLGSGIFIRAKIVGIVEPDDMTSSYWENVGIVYDPPPLEEPPDRGVRVNADQKPAALFVTREALIDVVGRSNPGTLVNPVWFVLVDIERLKELPISEVRGRLNAFEGELTASIPGSDVLAGIIKGKLDNLNRKSFFSRLPLLLLIAIMVATLLFYLSMVVSYLVQSREADLALLRTRGVGTSQLIRLYGFEGVLLTIVAIVVAPFVAIGAVALVGKLPFFTDITGGGTLPVELTPAPFLAALGIGLVCLFLFITLGLLGARGGLVLHKMRMSRPPTTPFFQRYYIDAALLVLGGLVFWELHSRGHIVSGGFFKDVEVNETLLLAPILFLIAIALVFLRLFPLFVRFASGESQALVHLVAAATLLVLVPGLAVRAIIDGNVTGWLGPVALLLVLAALYWGTARAERLRYRVAGIILQVVPVAAFLVMEPLSPGDVLFFPTIGLIGIVPAQVSFLLLKASTRSGPVWLSLGLWRMARNPMQYTWLVVLLLLATGLGTLSTTVGGTLDKSQRDRILYEVAADVRISGIPSFVARSEEVLRDTYSAIPGVISVSLARRYGGSVGPTSMQILAVDSLSFPYVSWYRDDFSDQSLGSVMAALSQHPQVEPLTIPNGATEIGLWIKPLEEYSNINVWMVVEHGSASIARLSVGALEGAEWHLLRAGIPSRLIPPLRLVSVQISEPGLGNTHSAGAILLDDIHVIAGPDSHEYVLENFEGLSRWMPISTDFLSSDRITQTDDEAYNGQKSGLFNFGTDTVVGLRGFYHSPTGGAIPVVASSSFMEATGASVGYRLTAEIGGRLIPVVIRDTVDLFPTMSPIGGGFLLADLNDLTSHLRILSPVTTIVPNEVFVKEIPAASDEVLQSVKILTRTYGQIRDRDSLLESMRVNPLTSPSWKATVIVSLGIVLIAAGLGYVTYLLAVADRSSDEMGFLQAVGLSRFQVFGLLAFEHLAVAAVGLGVGTWAGLVVSRLTVSSVAVTESGERLLPPFVLMTYWGLMLPVYAVLGVVFLAALFALHQAMVRVRIQAVSRVDWL